MNAKELAAVLLAVFLLGAIYIFLYPAPQPPPENNGYPAPFLTEQNTSIELFAQNLLFAEKVCIVEDLRGLESYPISRNNIMQCGIDFSGSEGLVGKELAVYVLEGEACTTTSGVKTIDECYEEIVSFSQDSSSSVIWIEKGNQSVSYARNILVQVNEQYLQGACSARFNVSEALPEPPEEENEPIALNDTEQPEMPELPPINDSGDSANGSADNSEEPGQE